MTLRTYVRLLAERWKMIVLLVIVTTGLAALVAVLTPKVYEAQAQIFVASTSASQPGFDYQGAAFTQTQVQTFARIVASPQVLERVKSDLNLAISNQTLKDKISATAPANESIVELQVQDGSPARAEEIANSAADAFVTVVEGYYAASNGQKPLRLFVTDPAVVPTNPVSPKRTLDIALGLLLGLVVGAAVAVVQDLLDNRIKEPEALSRIGGKPVMGVIVDDPEAGRHVIAARAGQRSVRAENFRQLRANLQFANLDAHPRVIAVTSSIPGEGKTMVSINLASTLAEAGFSVCLVDADLRRPTIARTLGLNGAVGLTNLLIQQIGLEESLQHIGTGLSVLTSGPTPPNPSEVLASEYTRTVIRSLVDRVDFVILDTAPLLPVADGSEVAALADGALLVARHKVTTDSQVKRAVANLRAVDASLIGVIHNRLPPRKSGEYGYAYYRADASGAPAANEIDLQRRQDEIDA